MGTKRPLEDHYEGDGKRMHYDQQDGVHPSRRSRFSDAPDERDRDSNTYRPSYEQRSPRQPRPDKRSRTDTLRRTDDSFRSPDARRPEPRKRRGRPPNKVKAASTSINALKAKIRDLTRLLVHPDSLPADIRIEKERALTGYKLDLDAAHKEKAKQATIKKYHMVRFFERQKATRALNKLTKLPPSPPTPAQQSQLHTARVNLNYTLYHPLHLKYTSLYPRPPSPGPPQLGARAARKPRADRPPPWALVEKCMAEGTLEALRDGKLGGGTLVVGRGRAEEGGKGKRRPGRGGEEVAREREREKGERKRRAGVRLTGGEVSEDEGDADGDGDGELSEGGFFEE